ncbi:DUF1996 domain-containing protein [Streptomyces sp. NPDC006997]|uniref:DUF1996 domain-containing protein n=1 Tax=Streptomyces sp. NPDC006997 TaxID=3155356 RepID=UPI0033F7DB72
MRRNTRRRPTGARRATFAAVALMLGGGGLVGVNVYASATDSGERVLLDGGRAATVDCPDVGARLTEVPDDARTEVDRELAALDQQVADAYQRLQETAAQGDTIDPAAITDPLQEQRGTSIGRITAAVDRSGEAPEGLADLASCAVSVTEAQPEPEQSQEQGQDQEQGPGQGQEDQGQGQGEQAGNGPVAADYADITSAQPTAQRPPRQADASRGTFTTSCGVNENGLFNSDNIIVAPGVSNGAHHFHDYIGNQSNTAFASDEDLANAETSCANPGDRSTYYWPVLRLRNGTVERDAESPGGGIEGNAGEIVTPAEVTLTFEGSPVGEVTAMPKLLRIITGDAKAFVNGTANANASWSCTGFEDRQLKDKYPLCPEGSDVVRTFRFQSCWDGSGIDSANHRTHVAFADAGGRCPEGFRAIPQLVQRIVYDVAAPSLGDGGRTTPLFAVDSFPEQLHKPVTDHGDFVNVFDEDLMDVMVGCINSGRTCDSTDLPDDGGTPPDENPSENPSEDPSENPSEEPSEDPGETAPPAEDPQESQEPEPSQQPGESEKAQDPKTASPAPASPKIRTSPPATVRPSDASDDGTAAAAQVTVAPSPERSGSLTAPQTVGGGLAETGAKLWPAAIGTVLLIGGGLLLTRTSRGRRTA